MSTVALEIVLILFLIIANGIFSGSEIAIVSARKVRLEQLAKNGNRGARLALKLANSPNDFFSSVQIGITLIGILSGALGGATVAQRLEETLAKIPAFEPYSQALSLGIIVSIITYLSLVIGELVPKRLALNNPEQIACMIARPMRLLARITAPLVGLLSASTDKVVKLMGIQASEEPPITEEEIKVLLEQGTQAGLFEESEQQMVSRVFRLGDRPIKGLMTPRMEIDWLDIDAPMEENRQQIMQSPHSRFPVARESLDDCLGIIRVRDLLAAHLAGRELDFVSMLQPALYVPEHARALEVLELFKESGTHIALVSDEYGGVEGLVTLNDLTEAIVGDLSSPGEQDEPMIIQREDGSWLLDGLLSIDELKEVIDKEYMPEEETSRYHTLAGFVINFLKKLPTSGDRFEWDGLIFEVVDMDGNRVDKVLVRPLPVKETSSEIE
jgi:putative hemolysin